MPKSVRRDPSKPGVAGITPELWADLDAGRRTIADLAAFAGTSAAAISKARRKRTPPAPPPAPPLAPASAPTELTADPDELARSFAMYALARAHDALAVGGLGPSAVKAATAAGVMALNELRALGIVRPQHADEDPAELVLREMTAAEAAEIRAQAEAELTAGAYDNTEEA